ncbi:aldehyde dehydrogenase family protein [Novosphingobium sp. TCA1]|uniref:aldehyde dehydrogenase family protein n=1 Tax=Novosphingobium sp. TCA1 TaxID=2682474 RepID=UPI001356A0BD|nr:aldehyde dehydrogenase family protein [Novosphingobium sp. TCA1]
MQFRMLIDGRLCDGASTIDILDPSTGHVLAPSWCADAGMAERAIAAAGCAFPSWKSLTPDDRGGALDALADAMEGRSEAFARLLTQEQGKTLAEARGEVGASIAALRYHAGLRLEERVLVDGPDERIVEQRYPLGVVAAIVPWNFPLLLLVLKLAPALAAGNCVIAKPAPTTPFTALMLGELAADLLPPGVFQTLGDDGTLGPFLTAHPGIAHVSFTGSTATGRKVFASAASTLKRFTLELGGNDAALVLDDADIAAVAPLLFEGAMSNAGQVCLGIKRIYAPHGKIDALCDALADLAGSSVPGSGLDPATTLGPVQNAAQHVRLAELLDESRALGRIVAGGSPLEREGWFVPPTIVRDLPDHARLVREEQFGPVIPVLGYDTLDEAVMRANDSEYGLGASIWSADAGRAVALASRIESGLVWVNRVFSLPFEVPIGGAKHSGIGRHQGLAGMEEFTQARIVNAALG